jgi:hypothetical protein
MLVLELPARIITEDGELGPELTLWIRALTTSRTPDDVNYVATQRRCMASDITVAWFSRKYL